MKVIYLFVELLLLAFVNAMYHPSEMCTMEDEYKEVEDCSFQFPPIKEKVCNVLTTKVCLEKTSQFLNTIVDYERQSEATFSVEILPYTAVINLGRGTEIVESDPLSAINITFSIQHGVSGLAFFIKDDSVNINFCRLLDFKDYSLDFKDYPLNLFYDCLYYLTERRIQNVTITLVSLPLLRSLSYFVFIPPQNQNSLCKWKSLIMVFKKTLSMGLVQVKFSTAPLHFNVSSYMIELINANSGEKIEQIAHQENRQAKQMIEIEFSSVSSGFYYVSVKPFHLQNSTCSFSNTKAFKVVAPFNIGRALALALSSFFLLALFLISVLKCCITYHNQELPYKQAFLVYFEEAYLKSLITSFSAYLNYSYKINIATCYGIIEDPSKWIVADPRTTSKDVFTKDPKKWIKRRYKDSDFIIFILSEGLYRALQEDSDVYVQGTSHWIRAVPDSKNYISFQIMNSSSALKKKFSFVCFPFSNETHIPPCISDIGNCFQLPIQMKSLLGFLFDYKPILPFTRLYPRLSRKDLGSVEKKKEFLNAIKSTEEAFKNGIGVAEYKKIFMRDHEREKHLQPGLIKNEDDIVETRESEMHLLSLSNEDEYRANKRQEVEMCAQSVLNKGERVSVVSDDIVPSNDMDSESDKVDYNFYSEMCKNKYIRFALEEFSADLQEHKENLHENVEDDLESIDDDSHDVIPTSELTSQILQVFYEDEDL